MKILVLGSTGMLGSMVFKYLQSNTDYKIVGTIRKQDSETESALVYFDASEFLNNQDSFSFVQNFDYIINCIGVIKPYCKDDNEVGVKKAIEINALFPHTLSTYCNSIKIVQIATDCVFSGDKGDYTENSPHDPLDVYGKTKSLGEVVSENVLHIRCSIVGPEIKTKASLLTWFLEQKNNTTIQGFSNHLWNGVTTLQFAHLCLKLIESEKFKEFRAISHVFHFTPNNTVTKYELLTLFQDIFKKEVTIEPTSSIQSINRSLATQFPSFTDFYGHDTLHNALIDLQKYIQKNS